MHIIKKKIEIHISCIRLTSGIFVKFLHLKRKKKKARLPIREVVKKTWAEISQNEKLNSHWDLLHTPKTAKINKLSISKEPRTHIFLMGKIFFSKGNEEITGTMLKSNAEWKKLNREEHMPLSLFTKGSKTGEVKTQATFSKRQVMTMKRLQRGTMKASWVLGRW